MRCQDEYYYRFEFSKRCFSVKIGSWNYSDAIDGCPIKESQDILTETLRILALFKLLITPDFECLPFLLGQNQTFCFAAVDFYTLYNSLCRFLSLSEKKKKKLNTRTIFESYIKIGLTGN